MREVTGTLLQAASNATSSAGMQTTTQRSRRQLRMHNFSFDYVKLSYYDN